MTDNNQEHIVKASGVTPEIEDSVNAVLSGILGEPVSTDNSPVESPSAEVAGQNEAGDWESEAAEGLPAATEAVFENEATTDPELDKAVQRLRLAGVPSKAIEGLSGEETLSWASHLAARESDVNRAFRERAELEKRLSELEATSAEEPGVPTAAIDLEAEKEALADQFGDDEAEALIRLAQKFGSTGTPEVEAMKSQLAVSSAMVEELLTERVRNELGARDSRLNDPETYQRVQDRASLLHKASQGDSRYDNLGLVQRYAKLMEDAALLELGPALESDGFNSVTETPSRRSGTPTRPSRARQSQKPTSPDDVIEAKIAAIQKGASAEAIRARFGG